MDRTQFKVNHSIIFSFAIFYVYHIVNANSKELFVLKAHVLLWLNIDRVIAWRYQLPLFSVHTYIFISAYLLISYSIYFLLLFVSYLFFFLPSHCCCLIILHLFTSKSLRHVFSTHSLRCITHHLDSSWYCRDETS